MRLRDVARNAVSGRRASCRWTGRRSESPALPTGLDSPGYRLAEAEWNRGRPADIGCGFWVESSFCISERRPGGGEGSLDRKSTRLNSSHTVISYAVFCLKKK